jgi:GxxExxY protein
VAQMEKEVYPEKDLTSQIIGIAFEISNKIGNGYPERIYQKAFQEKFTEKGIGFSRENYCSIKLDKTILGSYKLDFLVENKIVVELKVRDRIFSKDIAQILAYMKQVKKKVGLMLLFGPNGVEIKRLVM